MQVTTGFAESVSVSGLIREAAGARLADTDLDAFEKKLHAAGWRDDYSIRPMRGFTLRSRPLRPPVNAEFPALTLKRMAAVDMPLSPAARNLVLSRRRRPGRGALAAG